MLLLASAGLLKARSGGEGRARLPAWSSFVLGVLVSMAANVAAAPAVEWQPVLVAEVSASDSEVVTGADLLSAAMRMDEDHWVRWGEDCVCGNGRKELCVGAAKARALTRVVRDMSRPAFAGPTRPDAVLSGSDAVRPIE